VFFVIGGRGTGFAGIALSESDWLMNVVKEAVEIGEKRRAEYGEPDNKEAGHVLIG
jgi:hypothetical protein